MTILVLNSTGKVGQEIVRELHAANADYRAATGSLERAQSTWDFPAPAVYFSYDDRTTFAPVLQGVTRLFMLHPVDQPGRHHQLFGFIDAANVAGVKEIVFMSALGADLRPDDPLCLVEQYLDRGAAYYTILRPNWFMQNLSSGHDLRRINTQNEVLLPSGDARIALIDARDIAAVAAKLLLAGFQQDKTYTLTGSEALTYGDIVERLSARAGRTISHNSPTPESEIERMKAANVAAEHVNFMQWLFEDIRRGYTAAITNDVENILGRPPRTFDQFLGDYAQVWQLAAQS